MKRAGYLDNKASSVAGRKAKVLDEKKEAIVAQLGATSKKDERSISLDLQEGDSYRGKPLITAKNVDCTYADGEKIVEDVNLQVNYGDRISIFGKNSAGKTTVIKGLVGSEQVQTNGEVARADNLSVKTLDQDYSLVDRTQSVIDNLTKIDPTLSVSAIRQHLARFLFRESSDVNKLAGDLSGGEIARLALAMAVVAPIDLLVLDEPTNNLDIASVDEMEEALAEFKGGLIVVSHDLAFLKGIGIDKSYAISQGQFFNLSTNPSDGEYFKQELLTHI